MNDPQEALDREAERDLGEWERLVPALDLPADAAMASTPDSRSTSTASRCRDELAAILLKIPASVRDDLLARVAVADAAFVAGTVPDGSGLLRRSRVLFHVEPADQPWHLRVPPAGRYRLALDAAALRRASVS